MAKDVSQGRELTKASDENFARVQRAMKRHPRPTLPGVDLTWHMDRALEYINNSLDRQKDATVQGMPFYGNHFWPARLTHSVWDAPHCAGRLLHAITIWEETFERRNSDEETVRLLRDLLHACISEEDGLGHFHPVCKETQELDEHSQREVLLALVGLARVRQDHESLELARKLVKGYAAWVQRNPNAAGNYTWAGRFIQALLDYHRLTEDPLALTLAQSFVDRNQEANFDDKGSYGGGHNHSMLGTMANLIEFGIYTHQSRYVDRIRRVIDNGLWSVRSKYGLISEMHKTARGEANCTGDLIRAEILLGVHGYPDYYDDAERLVRNHLLASQFLDASLANNEKTDTPPHRDAARRCVGGFAFSLPNGLVDPDNYERPGGELVLALDLVQGAMDALIKVWDAIATRDEKGIWVNFLFSKITPDLEIRSFIPVEGRVELKVKKPSDVYVRIPKYVTLDSLHLSVDGKDLPKRMLGRYVLVPRQTGESIVSIRFEQKVHIEDEVIGGHTYRVEWLGDTVWSIAPAGKYVPLYYPARLALHGWTPTKEGTMAVPDPVPDQLTTPASGVRLTGGILKRVFNDNVERLLHTYPLDDILFRFRQRAGNPEPPGQSRGWEHTPPLLFGSLAGMFLMASGNALRWEENAALRGLMDQVVAGIEECKQPNDFIMAYAEKDTTKAENPNYVRAWLTHGLIEASIAGNAKALPLIRGHQDWFNRCEYLPKVKDLHLGYQGMIANTRMYFTSMGRKRDVEVVQQYYQEDWWLDQLVVKDARAIYKRPAAHCYEITAFEAYLDLYRATGTKRYLTAMLNAWDMIHDKWEHVGGSIAISWGEHINKDYPPHSYFIDWESPWTGELCGSVFWILLNQRLHRLYPDVEKYANEIEKSIYNIGVANQAGTAGIRYHALLNKQKDTVLKGDMQVSCCEGQAVRLYGSLPEYLYSVARDGLYVDMYSDSEITWNQGGTEVTLKNSTAFPEAEDVRLSISAAKPVAFTLRLRMPSWLTALVKISVNDVEVAQGTPGTYFPIKRTWKDGDTVSYTLPMDFKVSRYEGLDKIEGFDRYAIERGPVLLGVVGAFDHNDESIKIANDPARPADWLQPVAGKPFHYRIQGKPDHEYRPYYEIQDERYTCYPILVDPDSP